MKDKSLSLWDVSPSPWCDFPAAFRDLALPNPTSSTFDWMAKLLACCFGATCYQSEQILQVLPYHSHLPSGCQDRGENFNALFIEQLLLLLTDMFVCACVNSRKWKILWRKKAETRFYVQTKFNCRIFALLFQSNLVENLFQRRISQKKLVWLFLEARQENLICRCCCLWPLLKYSSHLHVCKNLEFGNAVCIEYHLNHICIRAGEWPWNPESVTKYRTCLLASRHSASRHTSFVR